MTDALGHTNVAVRFWAAISLGNINQQRHESEPIDILASLLEDITPAVRIASARALCHAGKSEVAVQLLITELSHENEWVRLLAAQVLDEIGEKARPASKEVQKKIDVDGNKYVVRVVN